MKVTLKRTAPNYRQRLSTHTIMRDLSLALFVLVAYSIGANFVNYGQEYGIKAIAIYMVSCVTALITEVIYAKVREKETKVSIVKHIKNSFPLVTALIFALTLPIGTPLYVVAIGAFIAIFFGKLVFGGFGQNIFNPALVGRVIVHLSFGAKLVPYLENNAIDALTTATPASAYMATNWIGNINYSLSQLFIGNYGGTLGETYTFLIILLGIFLAFRKVFDARITLSYVATCFLLALIVGFNSADNAFIYAITQLCIGGLAFGAVFMITDPVTSPTSPLGKILFGIGAGFITMLIRFKGNYPEGVLFSILIMNMLTPWLDRVTVGRINQKIGKQLMTIALVLVFAVTTTTVIGMKLQPVEETPSKEEPNGEEKKEAVYLVQEVPGGYLISSEGFGGSNNPMQIEVMISGNTIHSVEVINYSGETEYYGKDLIEVGSGGDLNANSQAFYDAIFASTIDPTTLDGIDTATGATKTADGILEAIKFAWNLAPKTDENGNTIYTVQATGFNKNNPMTLNIIVYPDATISVDVVNYPGETEYYGKDLIETGSSGDLNQKAQTFHDTILEGTFTIAELNGIDTATGATMTSTGIVEAVKEVYSSVPSYDEFGNMSATVKAEGFNANNLMEIKVTYHPTTGEVANIEMVSYAGETEYYGKDLIEVGLGGDLNSNAQIFHDAIFGGSLNLNDLDGIDTATGATKTAKGIITALQALPRNTASTLGAANQGDIIVRGKGFGGVNKPMYFKVTIENGVATAIDVLESSGETSGYGADLITSGQGSDLNANALTFHQTIFSGHLSSGELDGIDTSTGATMTAKGIIEALQKAFKIYE